MIKTIDTNEITEEMFQAFRDNYVDATRCIFAVLGAAPAVEPVQAVPPGYRLQAIAEFDEEALKKFEAAEIGGDGNG